MQIDSSSENIFLPKELVSPGSNSSPFLHHDNIALPANALPAKEAPSPYRSRPQSSLFTRKSLTRPGSPVRRQGRSSQLAHSSSSVSFSVPGRTFDDDDSKSLLVPSRSTVSLSSHGDTSVGLAVGEPLFHNLEWTISFYCIRRLIISTSLKWLHCLFFKLILNKILSTPTQWALLVKIFTDRFTLRSLIESKIVRAPFDGVTRKAPITFWTWSYTKGIRVL